MCVMTEIHLKRQGLAEGVQRSRFMPISPLLYFALQAVPSRHPGYPNPSTLSLTLGDH